jgi:D-beta-D-heptose 7-phosphate kinase/D-beta-D-heptose 1-phosphate adenosyltransferase
MKKIVLVTGGFDPIHSGHIAYFNAAKALGDVLVVGLNSDGWLSRKKGRPFMTWFERSQIVKNLKMVDYVIEYNDDDESSNLAIALTRQLFPNDRIIFANGGDRGDKNTLEMGYPDDNLEFAFGVGGQNKMNSSSWILDNYFENKTNRPWGYYRVLYETPTCKVKELTVNPGLSLSMQRHTYRNEYWHVVSGQGVVYEERQNSASRKDLYKDNHVNIPCGVWHKLSNESNEPLHIVEIQWGSKCIEEDIERR